MFYKNQEWSLKIIQWNTQAIRRRDPCQILSFKEEWAALMMMKDKVRAGFSQPVSPPFGL